MKKTILSSLVLATSLFASADLIKLAKDSGLVAMPSDNAILETLINKYTPDAQKYPTTAKRVELGKVLYLDPRISKSGLISCNTCHNLGLGGVDGIPASTGHLWTPNPSHLNAPTVYNSVFNSSQFWDGRANHLADQAQGPIQAGPEMAASPDLVIKKIESMPEYVKMFKEAYGNDVKIDFPLVATTIGIFERTLVTPSRFDKFLEGDEKALNDKEKVGLKTFIDKGCVACHTGINLGGTMQAFQIAAKYEFIDIGGFKGDKNGMVKTPTLRNIGLTAPYFHNGAIWSLEKAIKTMGSVQLGIDINDTDAKDIAVFLNSLTGEIPTITYPKFPQATDSTPTPDLEYKK